MKYLHIHNYSIHEPIQQKNLFTENSAAILRAFCKSGDDVKHNDG